jgi:hypothetical protein
MLFLATYVFLLRLPSEALPMVRGGDGFCEQGRQSVVSLIEGKLVLKLARRKNLPHGSVLTRSCWCASCKATCPVHVLGKFLMEFCPGDAPFAGISAGTALSLLRNLLEWLEVSNVTSYRTHDLRRGHAKDLQVSGASLAEILAAGQWRSPAFLQYLDIEQLEHDAVVEAHLEESSDSE